MVCYCVQSIAVAAKTDLIQEVARLQRQMDDKEQQVRPPTIASRTAIVAAISLGVPELFHACWYRQCLLAMTAVACLQLRRMTRALEDKDQTLAEAAPVIREQQRLSRGASSRASRGAGGGTRTSTVSSGYGNGKVVALGFGAD